MLGHGYSQITETSKRLKECIHISIRMYLWIFMQSYTHLLLRRSLVNGCLSAACNTLWRLVLCTFILES